MRHAIAAAHVTVRNGKFRIYYLTHRIEYHSRANWLQAYNADVSVGANFIWRIACQGLCTRTSDFPRVNGLYEQRRVPDQPSGSRWHCDSNPWRVGPVRSNSER